MGADDGLVQFCLPDLRKCPSGFEKIVPAIKKTFEFLVKDCINSPCDKGKKFRQSPFFCVWHNIPLCFGTWFLPCCLCATDLRTTAAITGNDCEHECLIAILLSMCMIYPCYKAKVRKDLRSKYGIEGAPIVDLCVVSLFAPCNTCQGANEVMGLAGLKVPFCNNGAKMSKEINDDLKAAANHAGEAVGVEQPLLG